MADVDNGYGTMVFPSVNEAIRYGTETLYAAELQDLVGRFDQSEVLVDDQPVPYARELWLPLLWLLIH